MGVTHSNGSLNVFLCASPHSLLIPARAPALRSVDGGGGCEALCSAGERRCV